MATKLEKARRQVNDKFRDHLAVAFKEKFGLEIESEWQGLLSDSGGALVSKRKDGQDFTPDQHAFVGAFSEGYGLALTELSEIR